MKTQMWPINQLTDAQLTEVGGALQKGAVVALATDTVYGLACDAFNQKAAERIYRLKERPAGMPLQILIGSEQAARQLVCWDERAARLANAYWPGALTVIALPTEKGKNLLHGQTGLGLRVPQHKGLLKLLNTLDFPLACTSANLHGKPVIMKEKELCEFCRGKVEYILAEGTLSPLASSVIDITQEAVLLREGAVSRRALEAVLKEPLK